MARGLHTGYGPNRLETVRHVSHKSHAQRGATIASRRGGTRPGLTGKGDCAPPLSRRCVREDSGRSADRHPSRRLVGPAGRTRSPHASWRRTPLAGSSLPARAPQTEHQQAPVRLRRFAGPRSGARRGSPSRKGDPKRGLAHPLRSRRSVWEDPSTCARPHGSVSRGSHTMNRLPFPFSVSTSICPFI